MAESADIMNISKELSSNAASMYCSIKGGSEQEKKAVFNASNNPMHKVGDYINKVINVRDVLAELIEVNKTDSNGHDMIGEDGQPITEMVPRIVLIDTDGESYQAVSMGIFNALKKAISIFGAPSWDDGLPCLIKQVSVKNGSMLTFDIK